MLIYRLDMRSTYPNNITLSFCLPYHWKSKGHQVFQYLFETIMGFLLPFSLINTCNSSVICRLQSAKFQRRAQGSRLILMVICTFAVFWLPYHIVNIIEVVGLLQDSKSAVTAALAARPNVTAFAYFSSAVNPILYVFAGSSTSARPASASWASSSRPPAWRTGPLLCRVKKRSVTCLLVLNLSIADAFVLLSAPLFLRYLAGGRGWEFGSAACKLVHYLSSVNMYVSIYLICLISMDRWLAVSRPFLSRRMRTKRSLLILLLAVWVLAFLMSLPMPFYRSNLKKTLPNNITLSFCVPYHWSNGHRVFQYLFETIMACLLPFSLINTCYSSVICRLQSAKFQRRAQGSRLILMIICTVAVSGCRITSQSTIDAALTARPNVTAFAYFSSAIHPILYVFAGSSHIRKAGLSFMAKLFEATNSESRTTSTFARSGRISRSSSSPDESSVLNTLHIKLGRPFKSKHKDRSGSVALQYMLELVLGFLIPYTVIVVSYICILRRLRQTKFLRRIRSEKLILAIVLTFCLFWLPYHLVNMVQVCQTSSLMSNTFFQALLSPSQPSRLNLIWHKSRAVTSAIAFISSCANPVLYFFVGKSYIRREGLAFMARLFEGTALDSATRKSRQNSQNSREKDKEADAVMLKEKDQDSSSNAKPVNNGK
ncbi:hypothetical protein F7725_004727 [Dissostichus mawsoni]|uniref:G-protein coupled receptors family 1 profile domain-containing protein n=1 Tax=Dissostichus mawsoni TaxID=36200 RepID=A0A7J5XK99_DISMA|nr:hypothetical protein F7725_004727 [Dissostichus mawsoni]